MDVLLVARRLTRKGLVVLPVPRPDTEHDGKTPVLKWKRYQTVRPTEREVTRWFSRGPMNLAILTGCLSAVVVVDVDGAEGLAWARARLPETPWRTRTAKGGHHYFRHPGGLVANRVRLVGDTTLPVDIRGDGGYVIAPCSLHKSGVRYRAEGDWSQPIAALPRFDLDWLPGTFVPAVERVTNDEGPRGHRSVTAPDVDVRIKRARAYLARVPPPEIGHGSDLATFTAACRLCRGFALSPHDAETLLWEWCGGRPGWDRQWISQKVNSAFAHGKEAMGALL